MEGVDRSSSPALLWLQPLKIAQIRLEAWCMPGNLSPDFQRTVQEVPTTVGGVLRIRVKYGVGVEEGLDVHSPGI